MRQQRRQQWGLSAWALEKGWVAWQGCWGLVAVPYPSPHARQPSIPDPPLPASCHRDCLQAVPGVVAGKENALAEDSRVLAAAGLALEESCRQLEGLRQQKAAAEGGSGGTAQKDGEPAGLCCAVLCYECRLLLQLRCSKRAAGGLSLSPGVGASTPADYLPLLVACRAGG